MRIQLRGLVAVAFLWATGSALAGSPLADRSQLNRLGYIPPQCFTRTQDAPGGAAQNPCYACHSEARPPNFDSQPELQLSYDFPQLQGGRQIVNEWSNLFVDRRQAIAAIDDGAVLAYVRQDNYRDAQGSIALAERLSPKSLPAAWDVDGDKRWGGYLPDAAFRFDARGFDIDAAGRPTGWRAYRYYPFPGAFMPTNGSFDDVLIRLPAAFRETADGRYDAEVYAANLAIIEALITRADVAIDPVDEKSLGVDLDRDGELGQARTVRYDWAPTQGRQMNYVGRAEAERRAGQLHLAAGLFPEGTEFLHSVRYLDVSADGHIEPAPRMKELRYARKRYWMSWSDLDVQATVEGKEEALNPDREELFHGDAERGMDNAKGWRYQGFIEDQAGALRPQSFAETAFCLGCHGGLSATEDSNFSFVRKLSGGTAHGWSEWGERPYDGLPDPKDASGQRAYASYLMANRAGDEYRANDEVRMRFFDADGQPRADAFARLESDLSTLLLPSRERALALDKAYWLLVREQSFDRGRDPLLAPAANVYREVPLEQSTGIASPLPFPPLAR